MLNIIYINICVRLFVRVDNWPYKDSVNVFHPSNISINQFCRLWNLIGLLGVSIVYAVFAEVASGLVKHGMSQLHLFSLVLSGKYLRDCTWRRYIISRTLLPKHRWIHNSAAIFLVARLARSILLTKLLAMAGSPPCNPPPSCQKMDLNGPPDMSLKAFDSAEAKQHNKKLPDGYSHKTPATRLSFAASPVKILTQMS